MALAVKWSIQAILNLDQILTYLEENWGEKVVREFVEALEKQIGLIAEYPRLFPATAHRENVRKVVLTKQVSLYYQLTREGYVKIITLFDVRQSSNNLNI